LRRGKRGQQAGRHSKAAVNRRTPGSRRGRDGKVAMRADLKIGPYSGNGKGARFGFGAASV